jgi:hypothetical protein
MTEGTFPVSLAQQRLWFLHRVEPASTAYHVTEAFSLRGPLDVARLATALDSLVARHEILRTVFTEVDGVPFQVPDAARPVTLDVTDLTGVPPGDAGPECDALVREVADEPYDFGTGPLLRTRLIRLAAERSVLAVGMHHIICDGWSMEVLYAEWSELYGGRGGPRLPELPVQFLDYAIWQREWLGGQAHRRQAEFWAATLADLPEPLRLPGGAARGAMPSGPAHVVDFELPGELDDRLRTLAAACQASMFMTLLAAFDVLLVRLSGQADLLVGVPVSGRTRGESQGLIGFLVNTVPVRLDLTDDPGFRDVVGRARDAVVSALEHQDLPFDQIVKIANPRRVPGLSPLVQATFQLFEGGRYATPAFPGVEALPLPLPESEATFDISLEMWRGRDGFGGRMRTRRDVIGPRAAQHMVAALRSLLQAVVDDPDCHVGGLPPASQVARPADEPPADEPPADEPPADEPPADELPADELAADELAVDELAG